MFYLHVEITNKKQLKKIRPNIIDPLLSNINKIVNTAGGESHETLSGMFYFHSTFRETSSLVVNCAFEIFTKLKKLDDKLYGFSIILSDSEWDDENLHLNIQNYIYSIEKENQIWLYEDNKNIFHKHLTIEQISGMKLVCNKRDETPGTEERLRRFCRRDAHIEGICDAIQNISSPFSENMILQVRGPRYSGKKYNLDEAMKIICKDEKVPMLYLNGSFSENPLDPFIWSLNNEIEANVSQYLSNGELDMWKSMSSEMSLFKNSWGAEQCTDYVAKDFIYLYTLYIKAYIKIRKEQDLIPVIICKDMDSWNKESINILNNLFQNFVLRDGLLPICISTDSLWFEGVKNIKSRTIHFKVYTVEDLKRRINLAFSDIEIEDRHIYTLYKKGNGLSIPMFHSLINYLETDQLSEYGDPSEGVLDSFDELTLNILYLVYIAQGLIPLENYIDFFIGKNFNAVKIRERMDHLYTLSFIVGSDYPKPLFPNLSRIIERKLKEPLAELINGFTNHIFLMWEKGKHLNIENLFRITVRYGQIGKSLQVYSVLLDRFLNNKQFKLADYYLDGNFYETAEMTIGESDALKNIRFSGRMRAALLEENYIKVQNIVSENEITKVHKKSAFSSNASLQYSIYMNCLGDYSRGLNLAKEALFGFQQSGDNVGEAKANIELATSLLGQGKIRTSQDYFEISRRASFQSLDLLSQIRSSFFKALSDFIFGNISMALRGVNDIKSVAEKAGRREWQIMLMHLKGRIFFDLGRYRDCEDNYKDAFQLAQQYSMTTAATMMKRWIARSLIYNERYRDGIDILKDMEQNNEVLFFMAEAAFFGKRGDKALDYMEKASKSYKRIDQIPGETPFWRDGYASIEGYSLSRDGEFDVLSNQINAFHLFLKGLNGDTNSAVLGFSELTGRINIQNPSNYVYKYFYLYSSILPDTYNEDEKKLKILSNSVRMLQARAGKFDDQKMKHSFLNYNYWNKKITDESVKRNFI